MLNTETSTASHFEVKALFGTFSAIEVIADEWRSLCEEGASNQPFYRPEWFEAYLSAFEPEARLLLLTVRSSGKLRAVLPLIEERAMFLGVPVKKLRSPTNLHSNRFDLTVGTSGRREALTVLWRALQDYSWDVLELRDVPAEAACRELLELAKKSDYPNGLWESMRTPYIPLQGDSRNTEEALGKKDSHFFSNLKKKMKKLEKSGPVRLEAINSFDQALLDNFYDIEFSTWKGREGTAIACDSDAREFYNLMAQAAARFGYLDLDVLRCGEEIVAMNLALTLDGKHFIPKTTYVEKFSQSSPGQLIMREAVRSCLERGVREFDFLGPWVSWKGHWTSVTREHSHCYAFKRGVKGKLLHFLLFQGATRVRKFQYYLQERKKAAKAPVTAEKAPSGTE